MRALSFGFFLCSLSFSLELNARLYNYEDLPLGERSSGMGNLGVALKDDVSSIFYNPAVLAWSRGSQVSAGVSSYARIDTRTGEYVSLFQSAKDNITRGGFASIPSMAGGFLKKGNLAWGGAVLVPFAYENSGSLEPDEDSRAAFESTFEDIWINVFFAQRVSARHSFGITAFYVSRELREQFFYFEDLGGGFDIDLVEQSWSANGISTILGGFYQLNQNLQIGYSVRLPVFVLGGQGVYYDAQSGVGENTNEEFAVKTFPMPIRFSLGAHYSFNRNMSLGADLHVYSGWKDNLSPQNFAEFSIDLRTTANLHVGWEHYLNKTLGYRLGMFSNLSAARETPRTLSAINDRVNMIGTTAAIVLREESGSISLGGWVQGGQGKSVSFGDSSQGVVPRSNYVYGGVIASTYRF